MNCKYCSHSCIKKGFNKSVQKYFCKICKCYQQKSYHYRICTKTDEFTIIKLTCIGVGISGIASYTGISKSNVVKMVKRIASQIQLKEIDEVNQEYEVDELHSFIRNKRNSIYLIYALNKQTKQD